MPHDGFTEGTGHLMKIKILGCYGAEFPGFKTMSFLINDSVLLDAGSVTSSLSIEEQERLTDILITHSHLDHIKDILFLADNLTGRIKNPINLVTTKEISAIIQTYFFNNTIWPDFTLIPTINEPVVRFKIIRTEERFKIDHLSVMAVAVNHTVDGVAYILSDPDGTIIHSGDTGPTERLWQVANGIIDLKAVFVETSFPNEMTELAQISKHLTPNMLKEELKKFKRSDIPVYVVHMKPQYLDILKEEIRGVDYPNLHLLEQGQELIF